MGKKGFTLAELLIVVAVIAVLVAIAIPIFTSKLEEAREGTDMANIRAAYAEVMSEALQSDQNHQSGLIKLKQTKDLWQNEKGAANLHSIANSVEGTPEGKGTAWVEYSTTNGVIIHYSGAAAEEEEKPTEEETKPVTIKTDDEVKAYLKEKAAGNQWTNTDYAPGTIIGYNNGNYAVVVGVTTNHGNGNVKTPDDNKYQNNGHIVTLSDKVTTSKSAPSNPKDGDVWQNQDDGKLYVYGSKSSTKWVAIK